MTLSEALAKINAKEEFVKQHIKVAEEAISDERAKITRQGKKLVEVNNMCAAYGDTTYHDHILIKVFYLKRRLKWLDLGNVRKEKSRISKILENMVGG
uniref:Uncharacterized protein n=1 Tax=Tanacetum cinerariifolium TaxID=118510 RepID=A0A6L2NVN5_TANCI|nr:hypothetical protein [Tanacetum cinerariifolium]